MTARLVLRPFNTIVSRPPSVHFIVKSLRRFRPEAAKDPMLHKAMAEAADPVLDTEGGYQLMIADPEVRPKVPTSSMWRHNPAAGSGS
jgi:hypothetical protein